MPGSTFRRFGIAVLTTWASAACVGAPRVQSQPGTRIEPQTAHATDVVSIVVSKDHRRALSVAADGDAVLWDMATARVVRHFMTLDPADAVALSPDGETAALCNEDVIERWNVVSGKRLWRVFAQPDAAADEDSAGCLDLAFAADGLRSSWRMAGRGACSTP